MTVERNTDDLKAKKTERMKYGNIYQSKLEVTEWAKKEATDIFFKYSVYFYLNTSI